MTARHQRRPGHPALHVVPKTAIALDRFHQVLALVGDVELRTRLRDLAGDLVVAVGDDLNNTVNRRLAEAGFAVAKAFDETSDIADGLTERPKGFEA